VKHKPGYISSVFYMYGIYLTSSTVSSFKANAVFQLLHRESIKTATIHSCI